MMSFFKSFLPYGTWSTLDYFMVGLMGIVLLVVAALVGALIFMFTVWLCRVIFYDFSYGPIKSYKGEVIEMEYTPPRTTTTFNGKFTTTSTTPEKNVVQMKTELGEFEVDSDRLYQRVRIGESVTVVSQERFMKPRFWEGQWEYDGQRLLTVTSEKKQTVEFNDEKPVSRHGKGY